MEALFLSVTGVQVMKEWLLVLYIFTGPWDQPGSVSKSIHPVAEFRTQQVCEKVAADLNKVPSAVKARCFQLRAEHQHSTTH